jgi:hypothetical protein
MNGNKWAAQQGGNGRWTHLSPTLGEDVTAEMLKAVFHGEVSGLRLERVYTPEELESVARAVLGERRGVKYEGLELGSALGVRSHWDYRYTLGREAWREYFPKAREAEAARKALFSEVGDPLEVVEATLRRIWPGPVGRMRHPRLGRELFAGMLRTGAPRLHFDWAPFDLEERDVVGQLGWNFYVFNPGPGGDLKMYRTLGLKPGNTRASGLEPVGNYDLPRELVAGAESDVIPCRTGDMVLAPNRFLHEVTPCDYEDQRLTVAAHVAWMRDGSLRLFS